MHYLFNNRFISDYDNIDFFENKMSLYQSINLDDINNNNENIDKNYDMLLYNSLISYDDSNFMICRFDNSNKPHQNFDHILRKIIINYNDDTDKFSLEYDTTFNLDLYMGNHNISCSIVKKNNELKLYIMGGRPMSIINISNTWKEKWPSYCENIKLIKSSNLSDNEVMRSRNWTDKQNFIEQDHVCPFYGNGLYAFEINDIQDFDSIVPLFKDKPTFHRWIGGNYDMCYGPNWSQVLSNRKNSTYEQYLEHIKNNLHDLYKGGLQAFDSTGSLIYNENEEKYYFYHRANIIDGSRNIQYTTSTNLIDWTPWNIIKYSKNQYEKYATGIYYQTNIFTLDNVKGYFGIMGYHEVKDLDFDHLNHNGKFHILYSDDCITWDTYENFIPDHIYEYETSFISNGSLLSKKNKYYLYTSRKRVIEIYSIDKNRLLYAHNMNNEIGKLLTKPIKIKNLNNIYMNFETFEDGYINVKLLDKNKNEIETYTYENFVNITENMNESSFKLTWKNDHIELEELQENNKELDENNEYYIEITGKNFKIYSICC